MNLSSILIKGILIFAICSSIAGSSAPYHPGDSSIPLRDLSAGDSPLKASGQASFHERISTQGIDEKCDLDGKLTNVSSKSILAFEASVDLFPHAGGGIHRDYKIDYIFDRDLLKPGSQFQLQMDPPGRQVTRSEDTSRQPLRAESRVTFVQFADGTQFGKSDWGDALSSDRKTEMNIMTSLLQTYESKKETGLSSAIDEGLAKRESKFVFALYLQIKEQIAAKGVEGGMTDVKDQLANARIHLNAL